MSRETVFLSYVKATADWIASGLPPASEEEVARLYRACQENCGDDLSPISMCPYCKCKLGLHRNPLTNKLANPTTQCPHPEGSKWTRGIASAESRNGR